MRAHVSMLNNRRLALGIFLWVFLALLMVKDIGMITSDSFGFIVNFTFGLFFSYYLIAFLFGWHMPHSVGLLKKGKHDFWRIIMLLVFVCLWLWSFFSA